MEVDTALIRNTDIGATMAVVGNGDKRTILSYGQGWNTVWDIRGVEKLEDLVTLRSRELWLWGLWGVVNRLCATASDESNAKHRCKKQFNATSHSRSICGKCSMHLPGK